MKRRCHLNKAFLILIITGYLWGFTSCDSNADKKNSSRQSKSAHSLSLKPYLNSITEKKQVMIAESPILGLSVTKDGNLIAYLHLSKLPSGGDSSHNATLIFPIELDLSNDAPYEWLFYFHGYHAKMSDILFGKYKLITQFLSAYGSSNSILIQPHDYYDGEISGLSWSGWADIAVLQQSFYEISQAISSIAQYVDKWKAYLDSHRPTNYFLHAHSGGCIALTRIFDSHYSDFTSKIDGVGCYDGYIEQMTAPFKKIIMDKSKDILYQDFWFKLNYTLSTNQLVEDDFLPFVKDLLPLKKERDATPLLLKVDGQAKQPILIEEINGSHYDAVIKRLSYYFKEAIAFESQRPTQPQ